MAFIKTFKTFFQIIVFVILVFLLLVLGVTALGLALKNERQLSPWGTGFFLISSGSMEPNLPVGSLIFVREVAADEINLNDIVTFFSSDGHDVITHRVIDVLIDQGEYTLITRGDANNTDDPPLNYDRVIGRVTYSVPGVSYLAHRFSNIRFIGIAVIGVGIILFIIGILSAKKKDTVKGDNEKSSLDIDESGRG